MSKSRGNVVYLEEAVEKWGADTVRLALLTHPQLHELEADSDLFSNTRVLIDEVCRRLKALKLNGFVPQRDVAEASYKTIHHIRTHLFKGIDAYNLLNLTDKISDKRRAVEYVFPVLKMLGLEDCIRAAGHNEG